MISFTLAMAFISLPPVTCVSIAAALSNVGRVYQQRVFQVAEPLRDVWCIDDGQCLEVHSGDPQLRTISLIHLPDDPDAGPRIETSMEASGVELPLASAVDREKIMSAQIIRHRSQITLSIFDAALKRKIFSYDVSAYFNDSPAEELPNGLIPRVQLVFSHDGQALLLVTSKAVQSFEFSNGTYKLGGGFVTPRADIQFGSFYNGQIIGMDSRGLTLHGEGYIPLALDADSPLPSSPFAIWNGTRPRLVSRPRSENETRLGVYRIRQMGNGRCPQLELDSFIPYLPHGDDDFQSGPDAIWIFRNSLWSYNSVNGTLVQTNLSTIKLQEPNR